MKTQQKPKYVPNEHPYQDIWNGWNLTLDRARTSSPEKILNLFTMYGEYDQVKGHIDTMIMDENYYQNKVDKLEEELDEQKDKLRDLIDDIEGIIGDLERAISGGVSAENDDIQAVMDELNKLI